MCPEWAAHRHHRHHVHPYLGLQQGRELGPWRLVVVLLDRGLLLSPHLPRLL